LHKAVGSIPSPASKQSLQLGWTLSTLPHITRATDRTLGLHRGLDSYDAFLQPPAELTETPGTRSWGEGGAWDVEIARGLLGRRVCVPR
jgi:hypothetical protein